MMIIICYAKILFKTVLIFRLLGDVSVEMDEAA